MTRIPVSIVTGFLGVGKTTFLNRLIATGALDKAALVINEFGDIGIDHLLIETAEEGIVELSGGCLCCTLRGDLADTLTRLMSRDPKPDRVVIETTGLADPGPIAQTVIAHPELNQHLELAGITTLIDCADGPAVLEAHEEARRQIALADRILVTKADIKETATTLPDVLQALNPTAVIVAAEESISPSLLDSASCETLPTFPVRPSPHNDISSVSLSTKSAMSVSTTDLLLGKLIEMCGERLLRVKGLIRTAEKPDQPLLVQGVAQNFDTPHFLTRWPDKQRQTRLVVIGHNLDETAIRRLFDSLTAGPSLDTPDQQALEENPLSVAGFF